jgi:hypothetical protein
MIGAVWSHTNYYYWDEHNNNLIDVAIKDEYGDIFKKSFVSLKIATPTVVISRDVFTKIHNLEFQASLKIGEDTQLWQDISKFYPIALIKEPLVKVRMRSDNTFKRTLDVLHYRANHFILIKHCESLPIVARIRGYIFYFTSKFLKLPSTPFKEFLAKCIVVCPYLIGRIYVKLLSFFNKKFKNFVL